MKSRGAVKVTAITVTLCDSTVIVAIFLSTLYKLTHKGKEITEIVKEKINLIKSMI